MISSPMPPTFKASRYNIITRLTGERALAYNAMSQATAVWEPADVCAYTSVAAGRSVRNEDIGSVKALASGGFILREDVDEIALMEAEYRRTRYSRTNWGLTIAPTLACNFGCDYCFQGQDKPSGKMPQEIRDATIGHIANVLKAGVVKDMGITWYGGEPLLARDVIHEMSLRVLELCRLRGVKYSGSIVTNGYSLTSAVAQQLVSDGVRMAQVTLDGAETSHDTRRVLLSNRGTFARIIGNLRDVVESTGLNISIRVNIDGRNASEIPILLQDLADRGFANRSNFSVYFAPVEAITEGCHAVASLCLTKSAYAQLETRLAKRAFELGLGPLPYTGRFRGVCGAVRPEALVVLPNGDLHKCWDTVASPSESIGHIYDVTDALASRAVRKWDLWSPFEESTCRACKLLPNCAGGCAHKFVNPEQTKGEAAELPCPSWKFDMRRRLLNLAVQKQVLLPGDWEPVCEHTDPSEFEIDSVDGKCGSAHSGGAPRPVVERNGEPL